MKTLKISFLFLFVVVLLSCKHDKKKHNDKMNFIIIITDDQRSDEMAAMPKFKKIIDEKGVFFTKAFVTTPLCCPSRSSILTGKMAHNNNLINNSPPLGGVDYFNDSVTVGTIMKNEGYSTAYIGKYLNGYGSKTPYVPVGWDYWSAFGVLNYYDFTLNTNKKVVSYPRPTYSTTTIFKNANEFIGQNKNNPFFAIIAPYAPHLPSTPEPKYAHLKSKKKYKNKTSFNEFDISDKPNYLQELPQMPNDIIEKIDELSSNRSRTLHSVDDGIYALFNTLKKCGLQKNTTIIFLSDNGFLLGEHRLLGKGLPYDESIGIPFAIISPFIHEGYVDTTNLVLNIDVLPTVADIAGINLSNYLKKDGLSINRLLTKAKDKWRDQFYFEMLDIAHKGDKKNIYLITKSICWGIRSGKYKYIENNKDKVELYDLSIDLNELNNVANDKKYATIVEQFEKNITEERTIMKRLMARYDSLYKIESYENYEKEFE